VSSFPSRRLFLLLLVAKHVIHAALVSIISIFKICYAHSKVGVHPAQNEGSRKRRRRRSNQYR